MFELVGTHLYHVLGVGGSLGAAGFSYTMFWVPRFFVPCSGVATVVGVEVFGSNLQVPQ